LNRGGPRFSVNPFAKDYSSPGKRAGVVTGIQRRFHYEGRDACLTWVMKFRFDHALGGQEASTNTYYHREKITVINMLNKVSLLI